jgi:hypothetical protein
MDYNQMTNNKYDVKYANFWALFEWYDQLNHSKAFLIVQLTIL